MKQNEEQWSNYHDYDMIQVTTIKATRWTLSKTWLVYSCSCDVLCLMGSIVAASSSCMTCFQPSYCKFCQTTPLLHCLHWFSVAAHIRFKTLLLAYKANNGPTKPYYPIAHKTHPALYHAPWKLRTLLDSSDPLSRYKEGLHFSSILAPWWWN